jgi:hypothetical protein
MGHLFGSELLDDTFLILLQHPFLVPDGMKVFNW